MAYEHRRGNQLKAAERLDVSRNVLRAHPGRLQIIRSRNDRATATPGWTDWSLWRETAQLRVLPPAQRTPGRGVLSPICARCGDML